MRRLGFGVAICAVTLATASSGQDQSSPKAKPDLPIFSFLGDDTESASYRSSLGTSPCDTAGAIKSCTAVKAVAIAGRPMRWMNMKYNRGKLYAVLGAFDDDGYRTISAAFVEKYGSPSVTEVRKWQSKAGASFDNSVMAWKFKGGTLELASIGLQLGTSSFVFYSAVNAPPAAKPKVDF